MFYIPKTLTDIPQWVCCKSNSKVPMKASYESMPASSTDPTTWNYFGSCWEAIERELYDNLGFVFNNNGIIGIDIDCGLDEDGFLSEIACDIINACNSFTEWSRSGRGVHIYLKGELPFKGQNNRKGVEIYKEARYFIVTGDCIVQKDVIENQEAIDYVLEKYFKAEPKQATNKKRTPTIYQPQYDILNGKVNLKPKYPKISQGTRNLSLLSLGGQLLNKNLTPKEIYEELLYCNNIACSPPLGVNEVQSILKSVMRYKNDTKNVV